jgi:hypothetical protein
MFDQLRDRRSRDRLKPRLDHLRQRTRAALVLTDLASRGRRLV